MKNEKKQGWLNDTETIVILSEFQYFETQGISYSSVFVASGFSVKTCPKVEMHSERHLPRFRHKNFVTVNFSVWNIFIER